jgi:hypothetical protein
VQVAMLAVCQELADPVGSQGLVDSPVLVDSLVLVDQVVQLIMMMVQRLRRLTRLVFSLLMIFLLVTVQGSSTLIDADLHFDKLGGSGDGIVVL